MQQVVFTANVGTTSLLDSPKHFGLDVCCEVDLLRTAMLQPRQVEFKAKIGTSSFPESVRHAGPDFCCRM